MQAKILNLENYTLHL